MNVLMEFTDMVFNLFLRAFAHFLLCDKLMSEYSKFPKLSFPFQLLYNT